jgi:hypothetical protein
LQPTDLLSPIHADLTTCSETTETSPVGDLLQCPLLPFVSTSFNGETIPLQAEDSLLAPRFINLETTGLRQSPQLAALNGITQDDPARGLHQFYKTTQITTDHKTKIGLVFSLCLQLSGHSMEFCHLKSSFRT